MTEERLYNLKYDSNNPDRDMLMNLVADVDEMAFNPNSSDSKAQGVGITDAIINLATENDMANDAGTFSITLVGTRKWDVALTPNDLVIIKMHPSVEVRNDVVMVGMISEVKKIGEYANNSTVYSITGLSMGKALMQMKLGTLQELSSIASTGWLSSISNTQDNETGTATGLSFVGSTASDVVQQIITFFLYGFANYRYGANTAGEKSLRDFMSLDLSSRSDEYVINTVPYLSFQGSLRQFISETQAKPFNEFYSDFSKDGKCVFKMRPTPFEEDDWKALPTIEITSSSVVEETLTKSDADAFSIFNCAVPVDLFGQTNTLLSKPQYAQELVAKYGYSIMEESNRYIYNITVSNTGSSGDSSSVALDTSGVSRVTSSDVEEIRKGSLAYDKSLGITAKMFNDYIKKKRPDSLFVGKGNVFIEAGEQSGLNPAYIFCHACLESAWGVSSMSYNFFGIGAFDNNPTNGHKYGNATIEEGIINGAKWIADNYYKKGQKSVYSMRWNNGVHQYATDKMWDTKIATQMADFYESSGIFTNSDSENSDTVSKAVTGGGMPYGQTTNEVLGNPNSSLGSGAFPYSIEQPTIKNESDKKDEKTEKKKKEKEDQEKSDLASTNSERLGKYSKYLFNWYADNPSYYNGSLRVVGHPDFRVGMVLKVYDPKALTTWEYYIEAVSHDFSYSSGYTTVLGVTRGLRANQDRFKHHNTSEDFLGGLFGEFSLQEQYNIAMQEREGSEEGEGSGDESSDSSSGDEGKVYRASYNSGWKGTVYAPTLGGINSQGDPTVTATGAPVVNFSTIAVDPLEIPYGSIIAIKVPNRPELTKLWHAEDTGGSIKGKHIDMCVSGDYANKKSFSGPIEMAYMSKGSGAPLAKENSKRLQEIFEEIDKKSLIAPTGSSNSLVQFSEKWRKPNKKSIYRLGGGHWSQKTNPFNSDATIYIDCSAYVGWALRTLKLKNWTDDNARGNTAQTYNTMKDSRFKSIHEGGHVKASKTTKNKILKDFAKPGDLLFFSSNQTNHATHVGVYMGMSGGKHYMVSSCGDGGAPDSGIRKDDLGVYWITEFTGRIRRVVF